MASLRGLHSLVICITLLGGPLSMTACTWPGAPRTEVVAPARVSYAMATSTGKRRASLRFVMDGLEAEMAGDPVDAQGDFERALQVDPSNPYAYLAIARHHVEGGDLESARAFLDQATALFDSQGALGSDVEVLVLGLRAEILRAEGHPTRAFPVSERARALGPEIWSDDHLSAEELY